MIHLYGRYEKTLDSKARLIVPKELRKRIGDSPLVLVKWFDRSLALFPEENWEAQALALSRLGSTTEAARATRRQFFGGAQAISFDNQGRITIPDFMVKFAYLDRDALLIGDWDKIEIWSLPRYREQEDRDDVNLDQRYEEALAMADRLARGEEVDPAGGDQ